ncbi:zinc-binding dehydrogenase [Nocardioides sp.]|uniref:zinc-binding dehydrogenase n=1 Tax=Nocardioides sp. TaxID=35761 RepID=UPI0039E686A7
MGERSWEVRLARVPGTRVSADDFALCDTLAPTPGDGEVLVRTAGLGLNAGLRHRLGTGRSTTLGPALDVGDVPRSDGVGTVAVSSDPALPVGTVVTGLLPWAGLAALPAAGLSVVDATTPLTELLTLRGHVGLTAYVALSRAGLRPGETVWCSAAAGGVGSCAVQLARAMGARVLASAGGRERVGFLRDELGIEYVLDRTGDLGVQLDGAAPEGIDVYLDLVGGDHLAAALPRLRDRGRVVLLGRVAGATEIRLDHAAMIRRRLEFVGVSVTDHPDALPELHALLDAATPPLRPVATVHHGPAAIAPAFADLLRGGSLGRGIVDVTSG